jgi:class 3 adenylate cyclase
VLEAAGPSEALAVAYIRLSGLAAFDRTGDLGLADAIRASEVAEAAGSGMALAWSWNFIALAKVAGGEVEEGFRHLEDSYQAALKGGHNFQVGNAVYNAVWIAVHLGRGRLAEKWAARIADATATGADAWPSYLLGLMALNQGRVRDALEVSRTAVQKARDTSHEKMLWRSLVLLAHALAENLQADRAVAELPPISTRVESQDAVYDSAARIRTHIAAGDLVAALADAKSVHPAMADRGSPADAISEATVSEPAWLRSFLEDMSANIAPESTPRSAAAHGRLALYEGRLEDAVRLLGLAEVTFREEGFLLDAWHVGVALGEAEARMGANELARERLEAIASDAAAADAGLVAKLSRDMAVRLGFEVKAAPDIAQAPVEEERVGTGERMVSVLFADVRGFTEMSGRSAPSEMAERIGSLQRWASQEVGRHRGLIDKFAGDAIMATFNISGHSVDHTLQALKAAIAIIDKAALAGLGVGAGIAVGPAVVGRLAESANVSVLGEVTNLAARLQAQSPAGEVTLSEEAHRRVRDWLEERQITAERLELQLKGFNGLVVAYRVRGGRVG